MHIIPMIRGFLRMQNRIRVLIADDNKEFCDIVRRYLEKQDDMEVIGIAGDGIEALEMIINIQPEVVILDIIMPHIDGLGVLERLNNSNLENKSKIIILSAVGQDKITQRAIALGADYYFVKPFDMEIFVKRIRELAMGITTDIDVPVSAVNQSAQALAVAPIVKTGYNNNSSLEADITNIIHEIGYRLILRVIII
jgi:two-component system response regulator (stage 0 sporulation protein A)